MAQNKRRRTPSQGLGDTIEKITEATGIKSVVKFILGEDCGCEERKEKLNKLWKYNTPLCLNETEYEYLSTFFEVKNRPVTPLAQMRLFDIHDRIFKLKGRQASGCESCVRDMISTMRRIYETYES